MNVDTDERTGGSEDNEDTGEDDEDEDMGEDDDDEDTGEGEDTEDTGEGNNETGSGCYILDLRVRGIRVWVRKEYVRIYDYCDRFWNPVEWGSIMPCIDVFLRGSQSSGTMTQGGFYS